MNVQPDWGFDQSNICLAGHVDIHSDPFKTSELK